MQNWVFLAVGMASMCACVCASACACVFVAWVGNLTQLAQLLCFCQAQIHCLLRDDQPVLLSLLMFVCSSHQLRLKRLDEGNGTTEALPATTQPLLLLTLYN